MPRSLQEIIDHAETLATQVEAAEPDGNGHRDDVAVLRSATLASAHADRALAETVAAARSDGLSWLAIGVVLGVSGEAARKRYGTAVTSR
ncbi:hypothetical protein [Iamia sp.]|uniref:hypothetical protein n=1 Tax=Iamia sp. TaxID=2722710 RepID=UPI002B74A01C|nr:hypothetical protein [Iamia sp.]HXH57370.1 hypothetical protein [Iamia sp.]